MADPWETTSDALLAEKCPVSGLVPDCQLLPCEHQFHWITICYLVSDDCPTCGKEATSFRNLEGTHVSEKGTMGHFVEHKTSSFSAALVCEKTIDVNGKPKYNFPQFSGYNS